MNLLSVHTLNTHSAGAIFDQEPGYACFSTQTGDCNKTFHWANNLPYIPVFNTGSISLQRVALYTKSFKGKHCIADLDMCAPQSFANWFPPVI
jgi:hypothetical protein